MTRTSSKQEIDDGVWIARTPDDGRQDCVLQGCGPTRSYVEGAYNEPGFVDETSSEDFLRRRDIPRAHGPVLVQATCTLVPAVRTIQRTQNGIRKIEARNSCP